MFHKQTKHIKVDLHFIQDKVVNKEICTPYFRSNSVLMLKQLKLSDKNTWRIS